MSRPPDADPWPGRASGFAGDLSRRLTPLRKTVLVTGALYVITFISIPTLVLYGPVLTDPNYIAGAGPDIPVIIGAILEVIVAPLVVAIICFFVLMAAQGLIGPNGGALASAQVPEHPGTGSAVLGFVQWVAAGTIAPIAGLGGEHTAVPMAVLKIAGAAASMVGLLVLARPRAMSERPAKPSSPGG